MKYSQAKQGRVFVIRLEDGDLIREEIERLAEEQSISCAALIIHGGKMPPAGMQEEADQPKTAFVSPRGVLSESQGSGLGL